MEGQRELTVRAEEKIRLTTDELWTPGNIEIRSTGKKAFVQYDPGSTAIIDERLDEAYIFCVSQEIRPEFGDSAYRIVDPNGFGGTLAKALKVSGVPVTRSA